MKTEKTELETNQRNLIAAQILNGFLARGQIYPLDEDQLLRTGDHSRESIDRSLAKQERTIDFYLKLSFKIADKILLHNS